MKALFVGLGGIGQRHLRNLLTLLKDSCQVYAYRIRKEPFVLDDQLRILDKETLENKYPITLLHSLDEAWEKKIDVVFICNPTSKHAEILYEAVHHGCDIFIEKPVSHNLDHLDEILQMPQYKSIITFVGYQNRYHPCIKQAKKLLEERKIGRVLSAYAEVGEDVRSWHKYEDYRRMYACRSDLGGGVVLSQIHELDYLYYLFKRLPHSLFATGGKLSNLEIDVEDVVDIQAIFEIEEQPIPVHIHEDYVQNPPSRRCKIIGTEGRMEFDLIHSTFLSYDSRGNITSDKTFPINRNDLFIEEMKSFLQSVEDRTPSELSLSEGMKSLNVALAVKKSLESGQIINLK